MSNRRMNEAPASASHANNATLGSDGILPSIHPVNSQARMGQVLDDHDHKRCSEGNHRALLAENLDQLRGLVKVLEADNWKFTSPSTEGRHSHQTDTGFTSSKW